MTDGCFGLFSFKEHLNPRTWLEGELKKYEDQIAAGGGGLKTLKNALPVLKAQAKLTGEVFLISQTRLFTKGPIGLLLSAFYTGKALLLLGTKELLS